MSFGPMPWHNRLELACEPSAVRWARLHAKDVLKRWGVPKTTTEDALLVLSELATNAVRHAGRQIEDPPPWATRARVRRFAVMLWCLPDHIQMYVSDEDRQPPILHSPNADDTSGRGLLLVEELSDRWGFIYPSPNPESGKAVWAELRFPGVHPPTDIEVEAQVLPPPQRRFTNDPLTMQHVRTGLTHG
ncbi:ATP-binding protein [Streptomyces sp. H27-D2]|uniref:ATP-binding protein n=1 Tax=Streptomyces sp. H27-D2 TaxID=3046304 RepID=UPI002DB7FC0D|nr:ATP-binding protein [Streptomyces sp. H27-D2]MEC4015154.1 ATP-binding protein [Streptomyces sp. H27-D2]